MIRVDDTTAKCPSCNALYSVKYSKKTYYLISIFFTIGMYILIKVISYFTTNFLLGIIIMLIFHLIIAITITKMINVLALTEITDD